MDSKELALQATALIDEFIADAERRAAETVEAAEARAEEIVAAAEAEAASLRNGASDEFKERLAEAQRALAALEDSGLPGSPPAAVPEGTGEQPKAKPKPTPKEPDPPKVEKRGKRGARKRSKVRRHSETEQREEGARVAALRMAADGATPGQIAAHLSEELSDERRQEITDEAIGLAGHDLARRRR